MKMVGDMVQKCLVGELKCPLFVLIFKGLNSSGIANTNTVNVKLLFVVFGICVVVRETLSHGIANTNTDTNKIKTKIQIKYKYSDCQIYICAFSIWVAVRGTLSHGMANTNEDKNENTNTKNANLIFIF